MTDLRTDLASLRLDGDVTKRPRGRLRALAILGILLVVGVALYVSRTVFAPPEVTVAQATVESGTGMSQGTPLLTASGYVVARRKAVVSAKIQGRLAQLRVEDGSHVKEGDVIARLESADFEAQVRRARAALAQTQAQVVAARATIRRSEADLAEASRLVGVNERLDKDALVSRDTLDASRSRVRVLAAVLGQAEADEVRARAAITQAEADVKYAEALLDNTVIRAPFTGVVVKKMAEVGESVAPIPPGVNLSSSSGAIVALADLETLEVEVDVAEANVAKLTPGQKADVTVEAFGEKHFAAELRQVIPTADRTKATVQVKVTILDKDANLKPEMSAKATFLEPAKPVEAGAVTRPDVLVPPQAVVTRDGGSKVFVLDGTVARVVPVVTGAPRRDRVVVTSGLAGTETVLVSPPETLKDGDTVRVKR